MKFKKIFIVILMLSVFLSGCQRQAITGMSKNNVSTSENAPIPSPSPIPTDASADQPTGRNTPIPSPSPIPTDASADQPTGRNTPTPTPSPTPTLVQKGLLKLEKAMLFCPPLTQIIILLDASVVQHIIITSLPYLLPCLSPVSPIILTLSAITTFLPTSLGVLFTMVAVKEEVSLESLTLILVFLAAFAYTDFECFFHLIRDWNAARFLFQIH